MMLSIVIVNWNAADVLPACLRSIERQRGVDIEHVVVVDNASTDGSIELLEALKDELGVPLTLIANSENRGYGAANNQGAGIARGEIVVLLNPDTEFIGENSLARLCGELAEPTVGVAGPRLRNPDGSMQVSCQATPSVLGAFVMASGIHRILSDRLKRRFAPGEWSHSCSTDTGWLRGACIALPLDVFQAIGGFSEATFMYGEDLEIAYDVRHQLGHRIRYTVAAEVLHHDDYSANQRWSSPERAARVARGELAFLQRHYPIARRSAIKGIMLGAYAARWMLHTIRADDRSGVYRAMTLAYIAGG